MQNWKRFRYITTSARIIFILLVLNTAYIQGAKLCPNGYYAWRKKLCLKITKRFDSWENAENICNKDGGSLASVQSASEMNFIRVLMMSGRAKEVYIGISREANSENFSNSDGSEPEYFNWRNSRTATKPRRQCAMISSRNGFKWMLTSCSKQLRYACKIIPDESKLPKPFRHRCYVCEGALSNEECNRNGMQECRVNELACQNEVRVQNGMKRIWKRCKQPQACENNYIQNPRAAWYPSQCSPSFRANSVCRCCCQGDQCNGSELPCLEDSSCDALVVPQNALITCTNEYRAGSQCTFRCEQGYRLLGDSSRRCNGVLRSWTSSSPTCEKISCPLPRNSIGNGEMTCTNGNNYGSTCLFRCNGNYTIRGRSSITCLAAGRWAASFPSCQRIRCPEILELDYGTVSRSGSPVIGSFRSFVCDESYFLQGADTLYCVDNNADGRGEWDKLLPECEVITCPEAVAPSNGSMVLSTAPIYDAVLAYSCDVGHFLVGNSASRCVDQNNDGIGEWDYPLPTCKEILCPDVVAPKDGKFANQKRREYGAEINVICEEGFYRVGEETIVCHDLNNDGLGEWDRSLPTCKVLTCPDVSSLPNGNVNLPESLSWGSLVEFTCEIGYFLRGPNVLRCIESNTYGEGRWNDTKPKCELIHCPELVAPGSGSFGQTLETSYNSTVKVLCEEGFFLVGTSTLVCEDPDNDGLGNWNEQLPQCRQISCEASPDAPENAYIFKLPSNPVYGTTSSFACDVGYFMIGSPDSNCGDSDEDGIGDWIGRNPICRRITCPELTAPPNGVISITDEYYYGSLVNVDCNDGFYLNGVGVLLCQDIDGNGEGSWNGTMTTCKRIVCPNIVPPNRGNIVGEMNVEYGSELSFVCEEGFFLTGNKTIDCRDKDMDGEGDWSDQPPVCRQITCPLLIPPNNGAMNAPSINYGSGATFFCNEGYFLIGALNTTCLDPNKDGNGEWNEIVPSCKQIVCDQLEPPANGLFASEPDYRWGSTIAFACQTGYYLNGQNSTMCVDDMNDGVGDWTEIIPNCQMITCLSPPTAEHGFLVISDETLRLGTELTIECNEGYYDFDGTVSVCSGDNSSSVGEWNGSFPQCNEIYCNIIEPPPNGDVVLPLTLVWGSSAKFSCNVGYTMIGLKTLTCTDSNSDGSGDWDDIAPTCQLIQCPNLQPPGNGRFQDNVDPFYGSSVNIICDQGFFLFGAPVLVCGDSDNDGVGDWNDQIPQCRQIICLEVPNTPANGFILSSPSNAVYGSVLIYACDEGYFMIGSPGSECGDRNVDGSGDWLGSLPICHQIRCLDLTAPPNGELVSAESFDFGATVTVQCNQGYVAVGVPTLLCEDSDSDGEGEWNGTIATCERITCTEINAPANGDVLGGKTFFWGNTFSFSCEEGFFLVGDSSITCDDFNSDGNGDWSNDPPTCKEITCGTLDPPDNGEVAAPTINYGSTASFSCNDGYFLTGEEILSCVDSNNDGVGEWNNESPTCKEILCNPLQPPSNGFSASGLNNRWGLTVSFACATGYFLKGQESLLCVDEPKDGIGEWTGIVPSCEMITCPSVPEATNGLYVISDETLRLGTEVTIECNEGYYDFVGTVSVCSGDNSSSVGEWNAFSRCNPILCPNVPLTPDGGDMLCTEENFYGSVCLFNCVPGYHLRGFSTIDCLDSDSNGIGEWTNSAPVCEQIVCLPMLVSPSNGNVSCSNNNKFDSNCHFSCNLGYFLSGQDLVHCVDQNLDGNGEWSDSPPICKQVTCDQRNSPKHGNVSCSDGPSYGSLCLFSCDVGFTLIGFDSIQCGEPVSGPSGRWNSETEPSCQINTCDKPSINPTNGSVQCSSENNYNSLCEYACDDGYRLIGKTSRTCLAEGVWSHPEPKCEIIRCKPTPTNPDDGVVFCTEEDKYGSVCNYFCDLGFQLVGESRSECTNTLEGDGFGTFDTSPGVCQAIYCPAIEGMQDGGTVICGIGSGNEEPHKYGSECALICFDGYRAQGASRTICLGKGEWTDKIGVCERFKCFPPLLEPDEGSKTCSSNNDSIGTVCRFQCSSNTRLIGTSEVTCLDSGEWSDVAPSCGR